MKQQRSQREAQCWVLVNISLSILTRGLSGHASACGWGDVLIGLKEKPFFPCRRTTPPRGFIAFCPRRGAGAGQPFG